MAGSEGKILQGRNVIILFCAYKIFYSSNAPQAGANEIDLAKLYSKKENKC